MKKESIYQLVSLCKIDEECNNRLIDLSKTFYQVIKEKENVDLPQALKESVRYSFSKMFNGDGLSMVKTIDSFNDEYFPQNIVSCLEKEMVNLEQTAFQNSLVTLFKNSTTFTTMYVGAYFLDNMNFDAMTESLIEVIKVLTNTRYFGMVVIKSLRKDSEFLRIYHNCYYDSYSYKAFDDVDFYFNFPLSNHNSIFYNLKNNLISFEKYSMGMQENRTTNKNCEEFEKLLFKHDSPLEKYDEVEGMLIDFDAFFNKQISANDMVNVFFKYVHKVKPKISNIFRLLMTLLTRCKSPQCFQFAVAAQNIFSYSKNQEKKYKFLQSLVKYDSLVGYALFSVKGMKKFDNYCFKIGKKMRGESMLYVYSLINYNSISNMDKVYELVKIPYINENIGPMVLRKMNPLDFLDGSTFVSLSEGLVEFYINLIYASIINLSVNLFELATLKDYPKLITFLYKNYFNEYPRLFNQINIPLLNYFDLSKNVKKEDKESLTELINSYISYEDDITFIDETLLKDKFDARLMLLMMEYYKYYPITLLSLTFKNNPYDASYFLRYFYTIDETKGFIKEWVLDIIAAIKIDNKKFNPKLWDKYNFKDFDEELYKEERIFYNLIVASLYIDVDLYKYVKLGISHYSKDIRRASYAALSKMDEDDYINDDELLKTIKENLELEIDLSTLVMMKNIVSNFNKKIS